MSTTVVSMARKFFDWTDWFRGDDGVYTFFDCVLRVAIGRYKAGEKIDRIDARSDGTLNIQGETYNVSEIDGKPGDNGIY